MKYIQTEDISASEYISRITAVTDKIREMTGETDMINEINSLLADYIYYEQELHRKLKRMERYVKLVEYYID